MEIQVTYLFRAGASAQCLPVVEQIPNRLTDFLLYVTQASNLRLSKDQKFDDIQLRTTKGQAQEEFEGSIEWLRKKAEAHASVDTLAKKFYATGKNTDLLRLKAILTAFFIFEQVKNPPDKRYDSFFAALVNLKSRKLALPDHLKILSWNYDSQFEIAFSAYSEIADLHSNQLALNIHPSEANFLADRFAIYKLNGTTGVYNSNWRTAENFFSNFDVEISTSLVETIVKAYAVFLKYSFQFHPMLTFAWESSSLAQETVNRAKEATKNTTVLVVIGYSFPFFNRGIDREIIRGMTNLKKVYFQAPGEEAKKYIDRFRSIIPDVERLNPEPISDVKQFFLPPEL